MFTVKQGIKLSAIVDKLELKITNPEASQSQVGAELLMQVVKNVGKCEQEIYEFVASVNKCTTEEAEDVDLIKFIKDFLADAELVSFFKSAAKSKVQG